jgi:hypothetical protein
MLTEPQRESARNYPLAMEAAKHRFKLIEQLGNFGPDRRANTLGIPIYFARELCFLQLRYLCEAVIAGCLMAHEGHTRQKSVLKLYEVHKIIGFLEDLNPQFFPTPVAIRRRFFADDSFKIDVVDDLARPHLTQTELLSLYGRCGSALHTLPLSKLMGSREPPLPNDFQDIWDWTEKLLGLLKCHRISFTDDPPYFWCGTLSLDLAQGGSRVEVFEPIVENGMVVGHNVGVSDWNPRQARLVATF